MAESIVGRWRWVVNGGEHPVKMFQPNGEIKNEPDSSWLCVDPKERRYQFVWANGRYTDTLTLSADGKSLTGQNNERLSIQGTRAD